MTLPISKRLEIRHRQPLAMDFRIHLVNVFLLFISVLQQTGTKDFKGLERGPATKSDEFLEKFRMAFDTPSSFLANYHRYGYIYARRYDGQIL